MHNNGRIVPSNILEYIIRRDRGDESFQLYASNTNFTVEKLADTVRKTLNSIPLSFGSCVMISSGLVAALEVEHDISAVAVVGDLKVNGLNIFKCKKNVPMPTGNDEIIQETWDGHCWVEINGIICDLSIFRSAYAIQSSSVLKAFILNNFGEGRGALLSPAESLPSGLKYVPKYALNDHQISGALGGLSAQAEGSI